MALSTVAAELLGQPPQGQPGCVWSGWAGQTSIPERKPSRSRRAPPYSATGSADSGSPTSTAIDPAFVLAAGEEGLDEIIIRRQQARIAVRPVAQRHGPIQATAACQLAVLLHPGRDTFRGLRCVRCRRRPHGHVEVVSRRHEHFQAATALLSDVGLERPVAFGGPHLPPGRVLDGEAVLLRLVHSPVRRVDRRRAVSEDVAEVADVAVVWIGVDGEVLADGAVEVHPARRTSMRAARRAIRAGPAWLVCRGFIVSLLSVSKFVPGRLPSQALLSHHSCAPQRYRLVVGPVSVGYRPG